MISEKHNVFQWSQTHSLHADAHAHIHTFTFISGQYNVRLAVQRVSLITYCNACCCSLCIFRKEKTFSYSMHASLAYFFCCLAMRCRCHSSSSWFCCCCCCRCCWWHVIVLLLFCSVAYWSARSLLYCMMVHLVKRKKLILCYIVVTVILVFYCQRSRLLHCIRVESHGERCQRKKKSVSWKIEKKTAPFIWKHIKEDREIAEQITYKLRSFLKGNLNWQR